MYQQDGPLPSASFVALADPKNDTDVEIQKIVEKQRLSMSLAERRRIEDRKNNVLQATTGIKH